MYPLPPIFHRAETDSWVKFSNETVAKVLTQGVLRILRLCSGLCSGLSLTLTFDISLSEKGDDGSSFRTENDPATPYQRSNYIKRKGAIDIRCSCLDVIHGQFSSETGVFATLIVLQFRFDADPRLYRFQQGILETCNIVRSGELRR